MKEFCTIQIYLNDQWKPIARFTPYTDQISRGYAGCGGHLEYDAQYVTEFLMDEDKVHRPRVSLPVPIDFLATRHDRWPAFLLDLVPTGAGRRGWLDRLSLKDNRIADWDLLTNGARYPVGWLRVGPGDDDLKEEYQEHSPGFTRSEVASREESFLEYMISHGASVAGSSDVQGESPKLLLTEDENGRLHADGSLPDHKSRKHWLVKFARQRTELERQIIRNEGPYLRFANSALANVHRTREIEFVEGRALFIPRFDRMWADGSVLRFGMESFASVAGTSEFGVRVSHEDHCNLILRYSSAPAEDLVEYLRRDILNVCLGNTDNHARNHAFLKRSGGEVRLSPLYDFAPMYLSDEGYARMARWGDDKEVRAQPDWSSVGKYVASLDDGPEASTIADMFDFLAGMFRFVQIYAQEAGIDSDILERRKLAIEENVRLLTDAAAAVLNP